MTEAMRLWPSFPPWFFGYLGYAYTFLNEEDNAIAAFEQSFDRDGNPLDFFSHGNLAIAFGTLAVKGEIRGAPGFEIELASPGAAA